MSLATVKTTIRGYFIDELPQAYRMFSVWVFALITALPDLYQTAGAAGLLTIESVPPKFQWAVRVAGIVGIYVRLVKQAQVAAAASTPVQ